MRLVAGLWCATVLTLTLAACGGSEPEERAAEPREPAAAPRRETVFDPLTSTIGRAEGVQQTVDEQAAEQRRRIDDAER
jgi:hypothetical protein